MPGTEPREGSIAAPMMPPLRQSRLSEGAVTPSQADVVVTKKPMEQSPPEMIQKRSSMAMPEIKLEPIRSGGMPSPSSSGAPTLSKSRMSQPEVPPLEKRPRMADQSQAVGGVVLGSSKMSSPMTSPSPQSSSRMRDPLPVTEGMPSRMRDRTPMVVSVDPTQAIAAAKEMARKTVEEVERRREPLGITESITYSKLVGRLEE